MHVKVISDVPSAGATMMDAQSEISTDLQDLQRQMQAMRQEIQDLKKENKKLREYINCQAVDMNKQSFIKENKQIEEAQKALNQTKKSVISKDNPPLKGGIKRHHEKTEETSPPPSKKKNR